MRDINNEAYYKAVGQRIRSLRLQNRMSQEALGAKLGITFQQVQKYEKGTNRVPVGRLVSIAALYNVQVTALMGVSMAAATKEDAGLVDKMLNSPRGVRLAEAFVTLPKDLQLSVSKLVENIGRRA